MNNLDLNQDTYIEKPDPNYSFERNQKIIDYVLAENDAMQNKLSDETRKNAGNVADILSTFAKYKLDRGGGKQIEEWLGKRIIREIYGDKLMEKVRMAEIIRLENLKKGNTLMNGYFYT